MLLKQNVSLLKMQKIRIDLASLCTIVSASAGAVYKSQLPELILTSLYLPPSH